MKNEIKYPEVRLFFDKIMTTVKVEKVSKGGVILTANEIGKPYTKQIVVAAGPNSNVKIGDEVEINFSLFPQKNVGPTQVGQVKDIGPDKYVTILPIEVIDDEKYFFITAREIKWVYGKEETQC